MKFIKNAGIYLLKNNNFFLDIYNSVNRKLNKKQFYEKLSQREKVSFFDYVQLSSPLPFYPFERVKDSNYYGYSQAIKKYASCNEFPYSIEHGLYYGDYIPKASFYKTTKQIITFSEHRKIIIQSKINKNVIPIGPYIHYAENNLSEQEISDIKNIFGKILLFFPSHSTSEDANTYDVENVIKQVENFKMQNGFDTVFVSLYYRDIQKVKINELYSNAGFHIVCAGHQYDPNFISRQKSIIHLADFTISNTVGTHLGYCIYMNKPHFIFLSKKRKFDDKITASKMELIYISSFFEEYYPQITTQQKTIVEKYWGINSIKTKEEMYNILKINNNEK